MSKIVIKIDNKEQVNWISKLIDLGVYWQIQFSKNVEYQSDVIEIIDAMYNLNDIKARLIRVDEDGSGALELDKIESLIVLQCFADEFNDSISDGIKVGEHMNGIVYTPSEDELIYLKDIYDIIADRYGHAHHYYSNRFYDKTIKWYLGLID